MIVYVTILEIGWPPSEDVQGIHSTAKRALAFRDDIILNDGYHVDEVTVYSWEVNKGFKQRLVNR